MSKYANILALFIYLFCLPLYAETLLELYQLAEQNDPKLKIAYSDYLVALEKKAQVQAPLLPQINLGANVTENWRNDEGMFAGNREDTGVGYNISLNYALYRKTLNIQQKQVNIQVKQAEAIYEGVKQELIGRLATSYFAILAAYDNLQFTKSAKEAFNRQRDEAQQRFDVGLNAITGVQEAQASYDLAVADEIQAQNELDNAYEILREITGNYHKILATLSEYMPLLSPEPVDLETWTKFALVQNPQVRAMQYNIETARQEIEKQRAANLPTIDLVANHRYNDALRGDENPLGDRSISNSIAIQLNYPLYEGGAIRSRTREAKIRQMQTIDKLEQQHRSVQSQTRQAFLNLLSNVSRVKALKQALISSKTALKATQTGFELGTRTSVDVVNAQRDLLRVQRDYASTRYNYILSTLHLKQASGSLNEDDLKAINHWLVQHTITIEID
ncbi:MAG: TolC family outer membrane protein [Thiomargarita sp.]|nr:TolC family outer membrane protein [Thiomargarita sp.]